MSNDPLKTETDVGFEMLKAFGIFSSLAITVVLLLLLNPAIGAALFGSIFAATPIGTTLTKSLDKQMDAIKSNTFAAATSSSATPDATLMAPLGYGEGLTARNDLTENAIIKSADIATRAKFPISELGQSSPLGYSSLVGKKTKAKIKAGGFFTTSNVEL